MKKIGIVCFIIVSMALPAQKSELKIFVLPVFGNEALILESKNYVNQNGDTLSIEGFRFYISNFKVYTGGKARAVKNSYFLVDAEKPNEGFLLKDVASEKIDSITFFIGVDSLANTSGALDGSLDPALGMFWAWNTGYINAKLEGKSKSCKTLHSAYEFHIGGYLSPYNSIRKITIKDPVQNGEIRLKADTAKWFYGGKTIDLKNFNSVLTPGASALIMADNYKNMFSRER